MNYQTIYNNLIRKRIQNPISMTECYCEAHHIIPKSLGGLNNSNNLVNLTAREHYIAHLLLYKIYKNTINEHKMLCAVLRTTMENGIKKRSLYCNSRLIEQLKLNKQNLCSKKYLLNGKYLTLREISKIYNINYDLLRKRVLTMDIQKAISYKKEKILTIDGISHTYQEWSKISGVSVINIRNRIYSGWNPKDAVFSKLIKPTEVVYKGKVYTIQQLADMFNVSFSTIKQNINNIEQLEKYVQTKNKVLYKGRLYDIKYLMKKYNLSKSGILKRISKNIDLDTVLDMHIEYQNKIYTVNQLSEMSGLHTSTIRERIKKGLPFDQIIDSENGKKYTFNGQSHSLTEWSNILNISRYVLYDRICQKHMSIDDAFTLPLSTPQKFLYQEKYYTLTELSNMFNISRRSLSYRVINQKLSVKDAIQKILYK